jgi:hypothetical protein
MHLYESFAQRFFVPHFKFELCIGARILAQMRT